MVGDPVADALMQELEGMSQDLIHEYIRDLIEGKESRHAPEALRQFFRDLKNLPEWYNSEEMLPGCRLFHRYSDLFLTAFVVSVIIEGLLPSSAYPSSRRAGL